LTEQTLLALAGIVVLGVGAQWLAGRLRLPSILLLLVLGFLAGPVFGLINPDETIGELLFPLVSIAVGIILFEGGLSLRLSELPKLGNVIFRQITIGALVTWLVAALAARYLIQLDWRLSVLLGAILIVTGPTVIAPLLRQIRPKGKSGTVLKWEGILIDPVGAVLAVLVFEAILEGEFNQAPSVIALGVLQTLVIGLVGGVLFAGIIILLFRRYWVADHLQNSMTLLMVVAALALSNLLQPEAGLLTVTVMGVVLANQNLVPIKHIVDFKENLQVLLIGTLFIVLASRLQLNEISPVVSWQGLAFVLILIVVARPLSVLLSTWRSDLNFKERIFLSWMAPRGIVAAAVASIFAFELAGTGHAGAEQLVSLTFLVIVATVAFYGLTAGPVAQRLGLSERNPQGVLFVGANRLSRTLAIILNEHGFRTALVDSDPQNVAASKKVGLPAIHGDALSEAILDELNLGGIGRMMATTTNNEVNSLAVLQFREVFGRAGVYQIATNNMANGQETIAQHLRGRILFGSTITCSQIQRRLEKGATIQVTELTEDFDYLSYQSLYNNQAVPLLLITDNRKLTIYTDDLQPLPRAGQTLISLAPAIDPTGPASSAEAADEKQQKANDPAQLAERSIDDPDDENRS
jgi:NhaP-type Na+/H+ or K+/H+ antiporter